jgi:triphosphoribosyl-dephospho-CoA synthase
MIRSAALRSPLQAIDTAVVGRAAIRALYAEVALYPKPGLVSPRDRGAHDDMDMGTFLRSLFALRGYFRDIAGAGAGGASFSELQALGNEAERRMLRATGGVNTHRGAIFSLGLLAAAAGGLLARRLSVQGDALGRFVADSWGADLRRAATGAPESHGSRAVRAHGVPGAREVAARGFPLLFRVALPVLDLTVSEVIDHEDVPVQCLFAIMAELDDTNLLHRGGREGLAFVKGEASAFLESGGIAHPQWRERALALHEACIARRLSPGGAADMLAAACFVRRLRTTFP